MKRLPRDEVSFSFSRSSGAGGQNVNKVNTKATLHWRITETKVPHDVMERFARRYAGFMTQDGEVQITSQENRTQKANIDECFKRLERMLEAVWYPPKPRKATKPTRSSVMKRLKGKKLDSEKKKLRGKVI